MISYYFARQLKARCTSHLKALAINVSSAKEAKHVIASVKRTKAFLLYNYMFRIQCRIYIKYKGVERHYFVEIPPLERGNQSRLVELFLGLF